jgi:hypothetical protein
VKKIADMQVGDRKWAYPWALYVDTQGRGWLDGSQAVYGSGEFGATLEIHKEPVGFVVWPPAHYEYERVLISKMLSDAMGYLQVARMEEAK